METVISLDLTIEELEEMNVKQLFKLSEFVQDLTEEMYQDNLTFVQELLSLQTDIISVIGSKLGY